MRNPQYVGYPLANATCSINQNMRPGWQSHLTKLFHISDCPRIACKRQTNWFFVFYEYFNLKAAFTSGHCVIEFRKKNETKNKTEKSFPIVHDVWVLSAVGIAFLLEQEVFEFLLLETKHYVWGDGVDELQLARRRIVLIRRRPKRAIKFHALLAEAHVVLEATVNFPQNVVNDLFGRHLSTQHLASANFSPEVTASVSEILSINGPNAYSTTLCVCIV